jgi:hypothetical protein
MDHLRTKLIGSILAFLLLLLGLPVVAEQALSLGSIKDALILGLIISCPPFLLSFYFILVHLTSPLIYPLIFYSRIGV